MTAFEAQSLAARVMEWPVSSPDGDGARQLKALKAMAGPDRPVLAALIENARVAALLSGMFEGSAYLSTLAERDPVRLQRCLVHDPDVYFTALTASFCSEIAALTDVSSVKRAMRAYKAEVALLTALADLGGVWPVMTVTRVLTTCADTAVSEAVRFLFRAALSKGQWRSADVTRPEVQSGYFVVAMGKQGAFELNYSSDIDLILFFDREKATYTGDGDVQSFFVRLTRELAVLLEERTADGYVFRTDLRLRPDAGATQIALSTAAAHGYYETVGQNWERAALIKGRVCAGDFNAGETFLSELVPFIWRKYLDYAAIADVHAMKRQIHAHKGIGAISALGQNVKLGRGGIREIEFFVQTQQLIAGGRQADLRVRATLDALGALEERGWVSAGVRGDLERAYLFLRRLEHRLQMVSDEQTHVMPETDEGLARIARFSGYDSGAGLEQDLIDVLKTVEAHYASLFESSPELTQAGHDMVLAGATDDPQTMAQLQQLGYSQPSQVLAIVRGWHHGRTPAVRSPRARELLTEVQPLLVEALADTVDPDAAIAEFDRFLSELPAGVQLFSLLKANPALLRLIADIMGSAPRLARSLSKRRRLFDVLLDQRASDIQITRQSLDDILAHEFVAARALRGGAGPMQGILDAARVVAAEQKFLVGVRVLAGTISAAEAGQAHSLIAERLISALLDHVMSDFELTHGRVTGGECAVLAMGKLGGREMTASSDIDLILVYDFDESAGPSDGGKPLAPPHYYGRLTQRLIAALSAQTAEGALYDVDMRLRPSGQKGPVATRFSSFVAYQANEAWTWEHMALTRARVIAGSPALSKRVTAEIYQVLRRPRDRVRIAADVRDMRQRIEQEKATADIWNLKYVAGGFVDLEFIAQHLQLVYAAGNPQSLDQTTLTAFSTMADLKLISSDDAAVLLEGGRLLQNLSQILRVSLEQGMAPPLAPKALQSRLAKVAGEETFADLETTLKQALNGIHEAFERLVR